LATGLK